MLADRRKFVAWLAWSLWALAVLLLALTVVFTALYPLSRGAVNFAIAILFVVTFQTMVALITARGSGCPGRRARECGEGDRAIPPLSRCGCAHQVAT
jgi:hypothetical protein